MLTLVSVLCVLLLLHTVSTSQFTYGLPSSTAFLRLQWANPAEIMPLLLIIGGDIVQKALAQLSGGYFVPVPFSFGWVAYSFSVLTAVFGGGKITPLPDCPSVVTNAQSGYRRENRSWVLGRLLRDFETPCESKTALRVVVFKTHGLTANRDWIWYSGVATMIIQMAMAIVPFVLKGNWVILMVTLVGTLLALAEGALPQWRSEKWAARQNSKKTVTLSRGNGSQHAMVIIPCGEKEPGHDEILDLEDLAGPRVMLQSHTRTLITIFALMRFALLICVGGLKEDAWWLLAIGAIGTVQNVVAATAPRPASAHGLDLKEIATFEGNKVMDVLKEVEDNYPHVGASLLPTFFPGALRTDEEKWWKQAAEKPRNSSS
jgi:hypothetical protein